MDLDTALKVTSVLGMVPDISVGMLPEAVPPSFARKKGTLGFLWEKLLGPSPASS